MSEHASVAAYDRTPRQAIAEMTAEARAAWRTRYLFDEGAELRVVALVRQVENSMRAEGKEVTIRTLWIALADRAAGGDPDTGAAAGLTGMALGIGC